MDTDRRKQRRNRSRADWQLASGPEITEERVEEVRDAFKIAWYTSLGMNPDEVGKLLEMSRATVYRQIKMAESEGLLYTKPRCALPTGSGAPELIGSVVMADVGEEVREAFPDKTTAPTEVLVAPIRGASGRGGELYRNIGRRVSSMAARRLAVAMLKDTRIVGIAYGRHCSDLSKTLPGGIESRLEPEVAGECQFFPMVGSLGARELAEELGLPEMSAESNAIRATRNMEIHGIEPSDDEVSFQRPPQVTQPCVIPEKAWTDPDLMRAAWRLLAMDESIRYIFGEAWCKWRLDDCRGKFPETAQGLLHEAHALVTGIGDVRNSRRLALVKLYPSLGGLAANAGAAADLAGYMFCHKNEYEEHREQLDEVNHRIVAPTLEDYVRATSRARMSNEGLGTMVLSSAGGEPEFSMAKARAIIAAISHGAINILCIDEMIAECIIRLREEEKEG